jgi:hypothetical protein
MMLWKNWIASTTYQCDEVVRKVHERLNYSLYQGMHLATTTESQSSFAYDVGNVRASWSSSQEIIQPMSTSPEQ